MVRRDTIEFENHISAKHNAKSSSFSPKEELEIQVILEEMVHEQIISGKPLLNLQNLSVQSL